MLCDEVQGGAGEGVARMAARIAAALVRQPDSWVLTTAAALYWRVRGDAERAINCVRHSLYHAPHNMRDIPLISLANIFHRSGTYASSLPRVGPE